MKKILHLIILVAILCMSFSYAVPVLANGTLTDVTAAPNESEAGATTGYTVSFSTITTGNIKTVDIAFPAGFNVSGVVLGTVSNLGEGAISVAGQVITYTVTNPAQVAAGTAISIALTGIINTQTAGSAYSITATVVTTDATPADVTEQRQFSRVRHCPLQL
jgi:hypothetical protein